MTIILDNLFPVLALLLLGNLLKRTHTTTDAFLGVADRLVYFVFFPAMLFWKIGGSPSDLAGELKLVLPVTIAVLVVYGLSTAFIVLGNIGAFQAGSFSQSCFRNNTYVGMAVSLSAYGDEGGRQFAILIGLTIPTINVLSVATLIWFGGYPASPSKRIAHTARALALNPLILGCLLGIAYSRVSSGFPLFVENTLRLASSVTLPLALLSIGGTLTLRGLRSHWRLSLVASFFKLALLPAVGFLSLTAFGISGLPFAIGMLYVALPTSTALYILSAQLNSDTTLASTAIAISTILAFGPMSAALFF
ncbi:MAG: AEC family transporter [Desulfobacteraceae bacterium]|nr:MAG: AEC family transporter [Desulfobacteraceae bacterium]